MQPMFFFEVLLLVAVIAGIFVPWQDRRHDVQRDTGHDGRRSADGQEPAAR